MRCDRCGKDRLDVKYQLGLNLYLCESCEEDLAPHSSKTSHVSEEVSA